MAFFGAFAHDFEAAVFEVCVENLEGAEFGGTAACVEEDVKDAFGTIRLVGFCGSSH